MKHYNPLINPGGLDVYFLSIKVLSIKAVSWDKMKVIPEM